jgi:hypothetical protein
MTSISCSTSGPSRFEARFMNRVTSDIASGKISQSDGQAIAGALGDLAQAFSSDPSSPAGAGPDTMRSNVDKAMSKLTPAQASELKSLLGGHRHHPPAAQEGQGASAALPGADGSDRENDGDADDRAGAIQAPGVQSANADPFASFLKVLRDAQQVLLTASYGSDGTTPPATSNAGSLGLVDKSV